MFYAGYGDMWKVIQNMAGRMPDVDAIAGVPVSGLAPAGMLSAATGIKCVPLEAVPDGVARLLVLEDASGFAKMREQRLGQAPGREVLYGAVYASNAAAELDLVGCIAPKPRIFTWNLMKSDKCSRIAYDLDGVLCEDPPADQIDYRHRYAAFLRATAKLRHIRSKLGWIVTGRMERYRPATEEWLEKAGIRYGELVMAGNDQQHTMEAHARHKADWYSAHPECWLFVESSPKQAERIAGLTGRPVICAATESKWNTTPSQEAKGRRNPRIIYTISTGEYERFGQFGYRPPPGWDYRVITSADCPPYLSPKQQAAWAKINGARIFEEYEASLCIDDDMIVCDDPLLAVKGPITLLRREEVPTWGEDLNIVADVRRGAPKDAIEAERARLIAAGIGDARCYLSGVVYRDHAPEVLRVCDEWWYWYCQSETQRDQPSLAMAISRTGANPHTVTEQEIKDVIRHDIRKADKDGVRVRVQTETEKTRKPTRRGDKT
jgi:hypothetical protein